MRVQEVLKAVNGAVIAGLGSVSAALAASSTHTMSVEGWVTVAVVVLTSFGVIFSVSNADPAVVAVPYVGPSAPMSVDPPVLPRTFPQPPVGGPSV